MTERSALHDRAAIVGIAHSGCVKQSTAPQPTMWLRTIIDAIDDAGLAVTDIDGIACYHTDPVPNTVLPTPFHLAESLGLDGLDWYGGPLGNGYAVGALGAASMAVATGHCETAVAIHTMSRPRSKGPVPYNYLGAQRPEGVHAFLAPYGYSVFMQYIAAWYQRLRWRYGITREQIGRLVVGQRANAILNPHAVMREPITLDDYLQSRWVSEPFCLLDVDMPVDATVVYVVTSPERARDLRQRPVLVAHAGTWTGPRSDYVFHHDYEELFPSRFAETFWQRSGFAPADMSFANLHDGFSVYVLLWLEALGFVGRGEAGEFVGAGGVDRVTGSLPVNTHGGNLSEGRTQGGGHVIEAVLQLRGAAGLRQLADPVACVVSAGGSPTVGAAVLHVV